MTSIGTAGRWVLAGTLAAAVWTGGAQAGQQGQAGRQGQAGQKALAGPDRKFVMEAAMGGMAEVRLGELSRTIRRRMPS
jgi:hypothetical protein